MIAQEPLGPCPHLEPCPWCGHPLEATWRRSNPRASCKTENCYGRKMAVVNLDDPRDVAAWNTRTPALAPHEIERIERSRAAHARATGEPYP